MIAVFEYPKTRDVDGMIMRYTISFVVGLSDLLVAMEAMDHLVR